MSRPARFLLLAAALLAAGAPGLAAPTADDLFSQETLHDVHVFINSRDFQQLIEHYEENTYYPADLQWGDMRIRNVAVRSRGLTSRVSVKPGLEVDFSRYVSGQRFLGLGSLVLDNRWQDPALFREAVTMAVFGRMGVTAPRESFCRLYINNIFYGIYGIVEAVDASYLERSFDDRNGYLFEYHNVEPFRGEYLGDDLDAYKPYFEPRTQRLAADPVLYLPIRNLFREVNHADDAVWRQNVERYLDVEQFVTYVAVETFMAEPDGVLGSNGMSNFYLYRPAGSEQHRLVPWDKDLSFDNPEFDLFRRADQNEILRRLLAYEDLMDLYLRRIEESARAAAADDWLVQQVDRLAALITEAAYEDTRKAADNEEFDERVEYLRNFARFRPSYVLQEVAAARQSLGLEPGPGPGQRPAAQGVSSSAATRRSPDTR